MKCEIEKMEFVGEEGFLGSWKKTLSSKRTILITYLAWTLIAIVVILTCLGGCAKQASAENFTTECSWYSNVETHNRRCADGKFHDLSKEFVCASWFYPLKTRLRITFIDRQNIPHQTEVTVVDRGPAKRLCRVGRCLDLSAKSFSTLAPLEKGIIKVSVEVL